MANGEQYLDAILAELKKGHRQWKRGDKLLEAFGHIRRRRTAITQINDELIKRNMLTVPELSTEMPLDRGITFYIKGKESPSDQSTPPLTEGEAVERIQLASSSEGVPGETVVVALEPPTADPERPIDRLPIVGNLDSADTPPTTISPSETVEKALYILSKHNYSQLVVVSGKATIRGVISYKSVAKAYHHGTPITVADCFDQVPVVDQNESMSKVVEYFVDYDVVLVAGPDKKLKESSRLMISPSSTTRQQLLFD